VVQDASRKNHANCLQAQRCGGWTSASVRERGGAVTALALATRYPGSVRTIVAHEPPVAVFLSNAAEAEEGIRDVYETYRRDGIRAAWARFGAFTGLAMLL